MSRSTSSRPSSSSRTAPPTIQASSPANPSRAFSSIDDHPPRPPRIGTDPADELVVDRPRHARVLLGEDAVPKDRHGGTDRLFALELDREGVHRDSSDHAAQLA